MKLFSIIFILIAIFTGCSSNNAFYRFKIDKTRENVENNIQSAKIKNEKNVDGLISAIYLNRVLEKQYKNKEYFYVYLYTKSDNKNIVFTLNGTKALTVEELQAKNQFNELIPSTSEWKKYYLVVFQKQGETLKLKVTNARFSSNNLVFEKNEL